MAIEIRIPSPGESISQVQLARWLVSDGETVDKDQEIVEIDSDKASFPLSSPAEGIIRIRAAEGDTVDVGSVIAVVEEIAGKVLTETENDKKSDSPATTGTKKVPGRVQVSPLARKMMEERKISIRDMAGRFPGKKITRKDIEGFSSRESAGSPAAPAGGSRETDRKKMTTLRMKLSERLVSVKNETAMLTTFNEVNMQKIIHIREKYGDLFREKYGVGIGFVSFFTRAAVIALKEFPQVNSMIDGDDLVTPRYMDIGIAVSAPKGLVVPVLRNAERMSMTDIELKIKELAGKARDNRITIDDMKGGTFTITNGGVFGSMMSTPILNPPQSAILGMHKILERPIAVNGQVVIAPMMYVALSYDHRVIDGRESVGFLVRIKELLEEPAKMLIEGIDPAGLLPEL